MKLSLVANGISIGARAVVELRDPHRALMADLSSANEILHAYTLQCTVQCPVLYMQGNI